MTELVYIASSSYSGSTLLALLLNRHPAIVSTGELKWGRIDPQTYRCSCGIRLPECSFWREVARRAATRGLAFEWADPGTSFRLPRVPMLDRVAQARIRGRVFEWVRGCTLSLSPAWRRACARTQAMNDVIIETAVRSRNAAVFVDASKEPVRLKHLMDSGRYRLRVIHLIRDGRGVMYSAMKNAGATAVDAALEWARTHQQIHHLAQRLEPSRYMELRYEDLCTSVDDSLGRIQHFLGLPQHPAHTNSVEHHVLGNRMRLAGSLDVRLDEKWRNVLSREALQTFDRVAGDVQRRYRFNGA